MPDHANDDTIHNYLDNPEWTKAFVDMARSLGVVSPNFSEGDLALVLQHADWDVVAGLARAGSYLILNQEEGFTPQEMIHMMATAVGLGMLMGYSLYTERG